MHVAFCGIFALLSAAALAGVTTLPNSTYLNPVIPGWHSDPSCVRVNKTYFCAVSSFLAVPGLPVYASSDLVNWKLVSHAWTRPDQIGLPNAARDVDYQQGGFYAPNLRYRSGQFHLTCAYVGPTTFNGVLGTTQTTRNPFDSDAWSDAVTWTAAAIDPDACSAHSSH
jgi:beta-xylosidase